MIESKGDKIFRMINGLVLVFLSLCMLYPLWDVVRVSFSTPAEISSLTFRLWPAELSLAGYRSVLRNTMIWDGYKNTMVRVILGVSISLLLMTVTAYPLSKRNFPGRTFWTLFVVFTMFFNGGLIPNYLLVKNLHLYNTLWSMILPGAIPTFSMLILRNYFMSLPDSLEESAKIDGAGVITILTRIILPLSAPILATLALWSAVGHWNAWFDCLIYIKDSKKYILQAILRKIIIDSSQAYTPDRIGQQEIDMGVSAEVIKCATIIVSTLPILLVYPFIQKYFVKGVMVGSLKG